MTNNWKEAKLADICDSIDYGYTTSASEAPVGPRFLRITDIVKNGIDWETVPYCEISDKDTDKYRLHDGDLVIARTGATTGYSCFIANPPNAIFASYLVRLKISSKANSRFISYYLKSPPFWAYLKGVLGDKSAQPNASARTMTQAKLRLPSLAEQNAIAHMLGTLDDKIELNRRMNETLEQMARAIFKSWFVDFEPVRAKTEGIKAAGVNAETAKLFPDSFHDSKFGTVPKRWQLGVLSDCCKKVENGGTPRRNEPTYWEPGTIPWLTSGEVRQDIIIRAKNYISEQGFTNSSTKLWSEGTTVVALYGATAGQVSLLAKEMCSNQACCGLTPLDNMKYYNYLHASSSVAKYELQARGSAQQNLSQQIVADLPTIIPDVNVIRKFNQFVQPVVDRWVANLHESEMLGSVRDALLPKLLSGEIRVKDAEKFAEGAA